ncbi:MAG: hypothetical protein HY231_12270 [Acidobacteria bacterium]|nr:hypothetical protein [Acidobacteriota bacterium]
MKILNSYSGDAWFALTEAAKGILFFAASTQGRFFFSLNIPDFWPAPVGLVAEKLSVEINR